MCVWWYIVWHDLRLVAFDCKIDHRNISIAETSIRLFSKRFCYRSSPMTIADSRRKVKSVSTLNSRRNKTIAQQARRRRRRKTTRSKQFFALECKIGSRTNDINDYTRRRRWQGTEAPTGWAEIRFTQANFLKEQ